MKGMKGIANIIPSMVGVITIPINAFTSSTPTPLPQLTEEKLNME